jgi:hypothetical protein
MTTDDALLFIDANKYLDLYRLPAGRFSLAAIREQADHIFVTQKVVDEVKRNTIKETANFLTNHFDELPFGGVKLMYPINFSEPVKTKARASGAKWRRSGK